MVIRLSETKLIDELCAHYNRSGFDAKPVGGGMVEVFRADAPTVEQGGREIELHLRVWEVLHPDAKVEIVR